MQYSIRFFITLESGIHICFTSTGKQQKQQELLTTVIIPNTWWLLRNIEDSSAVTPQLLHHSHCSTRSTRPTSLCISQCDHDAIIHEGSIYLVHIQCWILRFSTACAWCKSELERLQSHCARAMHHQCRRTRLAFAAWWCWYQQLMLMRLSCSRFDAHRRMWPTWMTGTWHTQSPACLDSPACHFLDFWRRPIFSSCIFSNASRTLSMRCISLSSSSPSSWSWRRQWRSCIHHVGAKYPQQAMPLEIVWLRNTAWCNQWKLMTISCWLQ